MSCPVIHCPTKHLIILVRRLNQSGHGFVTRRLFPSLAGNSLDYTDKDLEIMGKHGAAVKEMEAGAIAWVAQIYDVPLLCVKVQSWFCVGDALVPNAYAAKCVKYNTTSQCNCAGRVVCVCML